MGQALTEREIKFSYSPSDTRYWNGTADNWGNERKHLSDVDNPTVYFPKPERGQL